MMTSAEYHEDTLLTELESIPLDYDELTEASFTNLSATAALTTDLSQRKKVISKIREAKKPNTPIEDKLDLVGDALVHLAGAVTAVGAGSYKPKR